MKRFLSYFCSLAVAAFIVGCGKNSEAPAAGGGETAKPAGKKLTVALLPKSKGNAYFISCQKGAQKAASELGDELIFDGPTGTDPAKQNEIVENWITVGVDVIAAL